jgi:Endonuclease NucS
MLKKTNQGWTIISEEALENFVYIHLHVLLDLKPLKCQYTVNGEICDILALGRLGELVILELKNSEDRYVVQQLTRYYANLIEKKPLQDEVNYNLPIRLIAIAPGFHRHNWIDREYSKLEIDFFQFKIVDSEEKIYFNIDGLNEQRTVEMKFPEHKSLENSQVEENWQERVHRILYEYVRIRHGSKLGLLDLTPEELSRVTSLPKSKGAKIFKIILQELTEKGNNKQVSVRVTSSIKVGEFRWWVRHNIPTATGVITPSGQGWRWRS